MDFAARGASALAVSVDKVEDTRALASKEGLELPLLRADVELARAWRLAETEKPIFRPATLVVDVSGVVRYSHIGENVADRPDMAEILEALDQLQS